MGLRSDGCKMRRSIHFHTADLVLVVWKKGACVIFPELSLKWLLLLMSYQIFMAHYNSLYLILFNSSVQKVLFVPYALHDRDAYTKLARTAFNEMGNIS